MKNSSFFYFSFEIVPKAQSFFLKMGFIFLLRSDKYGLLSGQWIPADLPLSKSYPWYWDVFHHLHHFFF